MKEKQPGKVGIPYPTKQGKERWIRLLCSKRIPCYSFDPEKTTKQEIRSFLPKRIKIDSASNFHGVYRMLLDIPEAYSQLPY